MDKVKTNFRKSSKTILSALLYSGAIIIGGSTPQGSRSAWKLLGHSLREANNKKLQKIKDQQWKNSFYYLKGNNLLEMNYRGNQLYISLTKEGKLEAKKCKINELEIKKPKKWDGKWHILVFDIGEKDRAKREALRGKIKELGLYKLQKSIWVHPYDFTPEITELQKFFRFHKDEIILIRADKIQNKNSLKTYFNLN
jgi:hypothetical protein